jgi:hypothetical protein
VDPCPTLDRLTLDRLTLGTDAAVTGIAGRTLRVTRCTHDDSAG